MKEKTLLVLGSVSVAIFLLLFTYTLVLDFFPLTAEQEQTLQFLEGKEELKLDYSVAEQSHLQDVARVMEKVDIAFYLSGVILFLVVIYFWKNKPQLWKLLRYGGLVTVIFVALLLLGIMFAFNSSFIVFHLAFFPQGNWQFAADSLLIRTFPIEFFVKMSFFMLGMALVFGILVFLSWMVIKRVIQSTT